MEKVEPQRNDKQEGHEMSESSMLSAYVGGEGFLPILARETVVIAFYENKCAVQMYSTLCKLGFVHCTIGYSDFDVF